VKLTNLNFFPYRRVRKQIPVGKKNSDYCQRYRYQYLNDIFLRKGEQNQKRDQEYANQFVYQKNDEYIRIGSFPDIKDPPHQFEHQKFYHVNGD